MQLLVLASFYALIVRGLKIYPEDVDLVMAMGCSFTGGFLADNQLHEYRGAAFSCGGDQIYQHDQDNKDIPSIPNFFKRYNLNLKGFSTGMHFVEINGL
jgi:hypothetical protein